MRILVTGGAGYIGSSLVPVLLAAGHRVLVIDRLEHGGEPLLGSWANPLFEFRHGDIRDVEFVRSALQGTDAVVHLAAIVGDPACARHPEEARLINLAASEQLIAECRAKGVGRFVFASTCSNYGRMADGAGYMTEDSPLRPVSLYAETKVAVERAIIDQGRANSWCATALRLATVFGASPRMRFDLTVNEFTMEMLVNKKLLVFGEQFWRPYVHVRDAARAIRLVLEAEPSTVAGSVFNVGDTGQNFRKKDLVAMIEPYAPEATVEYVHKTEDPRDYRVDFARIRDRLRFSITRTVADGIAEVAHLVKSGAITDFAAARYRNTQ